MAMLVAREALARSVRGHRKFKAGVVAGIASAGLMAVSGNEPGKTTIENPGHASILQLQLDPGLYCDADALVAVKGVATRFSWRTVPSQVPVINNIRLHSWTQESMDAKIRAMVCLKTNSLKSAPLVDGHYTITLNASADPEKSDFQLIEYPNDPVNEKKYSETDNWAGKIGNLGLNAFTGAINAVAQTNLHPGSGTEDKLKALDMLQGMRTIASACGSTIINRLTAEGLPQGNMLTQVKQDLRMNIPSDGLTTIADEDEALSKVVFKIALDGTGLPNQYEDLYKKLNGKINGLEFQSPGDANCTDLSGVVTYATTQP